MRNLLLALLAVALGAPLSPLAAADDTSLSRRPAPSRAAAAYRARAPERAPANPSTTEPLSQTLLRAFQGVPSADPPSSVRRASHYRRSRFSQDRVATRDYEDSPAYGDEGASPIFSADGAGEHYPPTAVEPAQYCDDCGTQSGAACDSAGLCPSCDTCAPQLGCGPCRPYLTAGFAFTFLKPQFGDNVAFTSSTSDGATFENIQKQQFQYGLQTSPRVWLEFSRADDLGARIRYWQFDHDAGAITASPAANGFGRLRPPSFGSIDISTTVPADTMAATSGLELHALDVEGSKLAHFGSWALVATAGVRYGAFKQDYLNQVRNANGALAGEIDFRHNFDGVGPTFSLEARRWLCSGLTVFSTARGSLLFGNRRSTLAAGEDLDLTNPFLTNETNSRYDTIPVGEMQLGLDWRRPLGVSSTFFCQMAMEAQWWQDIGTAATEEGSLGLFGFNTAFGLAW